MAVDRPIYVLHLRPEPQADDPDGTRRLRAALKRLLRSYGLRCVRFDSNAEPKAQDAPAGQGGPGNGMSAGD